MPVNAGKKVVASDYARPFCELQNPASQPIATNFVTLSLPNVVEDTGGMASVATNAITIRQAGRYRLTGQCTWNAANAARGVFILINGQYRASVTQSNASGADTARLQVTRTMRLAVGDVITLQSWTNLAGNSDPNYGGVWLSAEFVSP